MCDREGEREKDWVREERNTKGEREERERDEER